MEIPERPMRSLVLACLFGHPDGEVLIDIEQTQME